LRAYLGRAGDDVSTLVLEDERVDEMRRERMLLWYLIAATIPGAIIGKLFDKRVDEYFHGEDLAKHVPVIAGALIVVALIMWASEKMATFRKPITGITALDAMIIGCAQACAVLPGVSRSGSTIAAGFFRGMSREAAVRFSFLLSTPLIAGAALLKGYHLMKEHPSHEMVMAMLLGIAVFAIWVGPDVVAPAWRHTFLFNNALIHPLTATPAADRCWGLAPWHGSSAAG